MLSEHFALAELTFSATAARLGLDNEPNPFQLANLRDTAERLEAVRALLGGHPLTITSAYRSVAVNQAVGGVQFSAHLSGHAADFVCPEYGSPLAICEALAAAHQIEFDQVIQEGSWVHISFLPPMRRQVLTKTAHGYSEGL